MKHKGECHCGKVTFQTDLDPMLVMTCNCTSCRKFVGSIAVRCIYASDEVEWAGDVVEYAYVGGSGGKLYTQHCSTCHVNVYITLDYMEGITSVPLGMFDDPTLFKPKLEIFTQSKLDWVKDDGCIVNSVPDMGVQERLVALLESLDNR